MKKRQKNAEIVTFEKLKIFAIFYSKVDAGRGDTIPKQ